MAKLLQLTNDFVFKRNFGYKGEEEITRVFLKDLFQTDIKIIELDNNPITEKEKNRAITCKGPSGINLEQSYTKAKRCFDETMTGAMCISTSPDANCGVVRELTVEPKVINSRGFIDCESPSTEMKQNTLFGFSELVNGVGVTMDDSIRKICAA